MNTYFTPTKQQTESADPAHSVWVTANAGSGKTHVLVERVIRLLLEGAQPATIMCITFTKAAAAEMSSRLFDRLSKWTSCTDNQLQTELERAGVNQPQSQQMILARRLFTLVLETPGGLKIQTIHALCERLLQLFPVEAGMAPRFRVLDERQSSQIRRAAQDQILTKAHSGEDVGLSKALSVVVDNAGSEVFEALIKNFMAAPQKIRDLLDTNLDADAFSLLLKNSLGLELSEDVESLSEKINQIDEAAYQFHGNVLLQKGIFGKHDTAAYMLAAVQQPDRTALLKQAYFTKSEILEPRKKLMSKATSEQSPETQDFVTNEQARLLLLFQQKDMMLRIDATAAIFVLAKAIHQNIEIQKSSRGTYDFDDLIKRTNALLHNSRAAQWVLYKLDSGLNHILLDEAQDTSPAQWSIIQALGEEFFAGAGRPQPLERTIFVVGDRKQSIYSFQGADAESFAIARSRFTDFIKSKGKSPVEIELNISYRSTEAVLDAVNRVFPASNPQRFGFPPEDIFEQDHTTNRVGAKGRCEVWPLIVPEEDEENLDYWLAPIDREPARSPKRRLARQIAETIRNWIGFRKLESQNRVIEPGDILILLQSRGTLFSMLIAELRKIGVPVAGADRLKLRESIVIQDLLLLAQWILLPQDDFALACILKSPFVPAPLDEAQLFGLAYDRGPKTLWNQLCDSNDQNTHWLNELVSVASELTPYNFFAKVLLRFRKSMLGRLGPESGDATDAFLDQTLSYEIEFGSSLSGFLHWFNAGETEIKRELEKTAGEVRLMTVHGAKGLEANIVFLPDAASVPKGRDGNLLLVLRNQETDLRLPLWMLSGLSISDEFQKRIDEVKFKEVAERNRLLYVAMTRARDELYICGAKGKTKELPKDCWYSIVEPILGVTPHQTVAHATEKFHLSQQHSKTQLPSWIYEAAKDEKTKEWRSVSQLASRSLNPVSKYRAEELQRGTAIHRLLQSLPNIAHEHQVAFAKNQARRINLDEATAISLVTLVNAPELEIFFGPDSEAEVEISGILADGRVVVGRIDRIVRTSKEIILFDYKSDRFVPDSIGPEHTYAHQISLYAGLIKAAFPDHHVKAALLWTQTSRLEWISEGLMAQAQAEVFSLPEIQRS